jgi:long-chain acyl-CoA synthetase
LGKIRRHLLPSLYTQAKQGLVQSESASTGPMSIADMSEKDQALLAHPAAREVWELLAGRYPDKRLSPDTSPQLDLGVDSLEWLTLTLEVSERTGVELSDAAIGRISTVRDLLQEVSSAAESEAVAPAKLANPEELLSEEEKRWLTPPGPLLRALWVVLFPIYRLLARLLFRVKVYGLENLPDSGNFVLTPNHSSMLDAPMLAAVLPDRHLRQTHWAGAAEIMLRNPLMRLVSRMAGVLPIERFGGGTGIKNLALALAVLQRGRNVVWFPEGRISMTGTMLPFREGIGLVLEQCPALVVPVYIQGTREAMPPASVWPKPGQVTVTFGPPCDPRALAQQGQGDNIPARMVQALHERVAALDQQPKR